MASPITEEPPDKGDCVAIFITVLPLLVSVPSEELDGEPEEHAAKIPTVKTLERSNPIDFLNFIVNPLISICI